MDNGGSRNIRRKQLLIKGEKITNFRSIIFEPNPSSVIKKRSNEYCENILTSLKQINAWFM